MYDKGMTKVWQIYDKGMTKVWQMYDIRLQLDSK